MLPLSKLFALKRQTIDLWLVALLILAFLTMAITVSDPLARDALCSWGFCFRSSNPEYWNSLFHTVASGAVISLIFYWLLVELPRYQKRARLKRIFALQYRSFKLQCIDIFLVLSKSSSDLETAVRLLDPTEFRLFYKQEADDHQDRWYRVLNGLNDYYLDALARKMEHLRDELRIFLLAVESDDEELVELLSRFTEMTHYMITRSDGYDEVKSFSRYLWQVFAGYSFSEGYRNNDIVLEAIERI